ncbi:hypothetical protein [Gorillibacterium massiliense]|uniref:hypothetical protein n=1 Tax=Gorillibacterium massiliense TaxID=1280390 RepID=UPI0004ADD69A|nr:hypothetical protein [Gorillibacterium massiliense]
MLARNKGRIAAAALIVITAVYIAVWFIGNSLSYQLYKQGFSKNDIIHEEGYSFYDPSNRLTKIMLLADKHKLALFEVEKRPIWGWKVQPAYLVLHDPKDGEYTYLLGTNIKISWGTFAHEYHLFLARYVDTITPEYSHTRPPVITGNEHMYLNTVYMVANGRTLLFAHAMSNDPDNGPDFNQITQYIDSKLAP